MVAKYLLFLVSLHDYSLNFIKLIALQYISMKLQYNRDREFILCMILLIDYVIHGNKKITKQYF